MAKKQGQQDNGLQNRRMRQYNGQKNRDNSTMVYKIEE